MTNGKRQIWGTVSLVLALTIAGGCGGGEGGGGQMDSEREDEGGEMSSPAELGPIDEALAERGEELFAARGCNACHRIGGGRLVGPDLAGVTERRSRAFIVGMIVNPDSMLANDDTAKQLLAEYYTPMTNQGVTRADALALFEYLRHEDAEGE